MVHLSERQSLAQVLKKTLISYRPMRAAFRAISRPPSKRVLSLEPSFASLVGLGYTHIRFCALTVRNSYRKNWSKVGAFHFQCSIYYRRNCYDGCNALTVEHMLVHSIAIETICLPNRQANL